MDVLVGTQKIPLDFTVKLEGEKLDEKSKTHENGSQSNKIVMQQDMKIK